MGMSPYRAAFLLIASFCLLCRPAAAQTQSFADTTTITPIGPTSPCTAPALVTLNVPDALIIQDLDLRVLIQHAFRTDVNLTLISPSGTSADLLTGPFGAGFANYVVRFDDEANVVVDTGAHAAGQALGSAPLPVRSEGDPLSVFDGELAQGDWTISVCDVFVGADNGELREFELLITPMVPLTSTKTVRLLETDGFAVPGADLIYTITLENTTGAPVDGDTLLIIDTLPPEVIFFNGDVDGAGPLQNTISFTQTGNTLTFDPVADIGFSNSQVRPADFSDCDYSPTLGFDPAIRFVCINPKGIFEAGPPNPSASFSFRVRIR